MSKDKITIDDPTSYEEDVKILDPDYSLRKIIGDVDLKQIFSTENITKAQNVIEAHKDSFLDWVKKDLATLEDHYQKANNDIPASDAEVKKLAKIAFIIKSQAGTFGFTLGTLIAKSLDDFCNRDYQPSPEHLTVIRKHIDTLQVVFTKNITGDGGAMGTELNGNLYKLVSKYKAK